MQGTGIGHDDRFIHYLGGGTWGPRKRWLNDCSQARFEYVTKVTGTSGRELVPHYSIAVDKTLIPLGWSVWIDTEGAWFRADDTGKAIGGKHVDVYRGLDAAEVAEDWSTIYVTPEPHAWDDPSPWAEPGTGMSSAPGSTPSGGSPDYTCGVNLDGWGECQGGTAYWCEDGTVVYRPCAELGMDCGIVSASVGYYCLPPGTVTQI
jgi:3D (Asp-Asp-Asp) domain-containing protein